MPHLKLFCACEKVIIGADDNQVSLISLLREIQIDRLPVEGVAGSDKPADGALLPLKWAIFALWRLGSEESAREFEQRVTVADALGRPVINTTQRVAFEEGKTEMRVIANVMGFPAAHAGRCAVRLEMRAPGGDWRELASDDVVVIHGAS
jgi:hypothetical protein